MRLSIIAAVASNGVIGRAGKLPWHLSDDLRRFKRLTMGHTLIMGRRTWESIGRPLPGRRIIVVTRQPRYPVPEVVRTAASFEEAVRLAAAAGEEEVFVVGGAELYREALPRADRMYFTSVLADVEGDTYFPVPLEALDGRSWTILESEHHPADGRNEFSFDLLTLERRETKATHERHDRHR
jgi:dihydrofolate reductase